MSDINPAPSPGFLNSPASPVHPAMIDSNGSVANLGTSRPVGLPAVDGAQTKTYAIGSVEHSAAVMNAAGTVETVR
jgi:hypothetical protein